MVDSPVMDPLVVLGPLRPGAGANQRDLDAALGDVRHALQGGQAAHSLLNAVARELAVISTRRPAAVFLSGAEPGPLTSVAARVDVAPAMREGDAAAARI